MKRRKSLEVEICNLEDLQKTITELKERYNNFNTEIEVKEVRWFVSNKFYVELWRIQ